MNNIYTVGYQPLDQAGGLSFKQITNGIGKAYNWARKNRPVKHLNEFLDKVVPVAARSNPIYNGIRNATGQVEAAGFGAGGAHVVHVVHHHGKTKKSKAAGGKKSHKPAGGKRKKKKK